MTFSTSSWYIVDMSAMRKLIVVCALSFLFVWYFSTISSNNNYNNNSNNNGDSYRYEELKAELSRFRDTTSELEALLENVKDKCNVWDPELPVIYGITPTYTRPVQKAELTRVSHTFRLVQNFHWIVVEDNNVSTPVVANLLRSSGLNYTHLIAPTPPSWKRKLKEPKWKKPRGVAQRNAAIRWLRTNRNSNTDKGIVYFADDDNTYSLQVFDEMRTISKVGVWPVGLVGGLMVEKPILDKDTNRVVGWNSHWRPERAFPIDMAGFAINLQHLLAHPSAEFTFNVERGYQESAILSQLIKVTDLEPKASYCTKVYVWHTRTEEPNLRDEKVLEKTGKKSNDGIEV